MSIYTLARALQSAGADGGPLVDHIYNDPLLMFGQEAGYIEKYFAEDLRKLIWNGSTALGGMVTLSNAAANLKSALQRRFLSTGQFPMTTLYHATKSAEIANLILASGFRAATETLYGGGVYFFNNRTKTEDFCRSQGTGRVLEVTIFSNVSVGDPHLPGRDYATLQTTNGGNIFLVKNALLIFPKAVITP